MKLIFQITMVLLSVILLSCIRTVQYPSINWETYHSEFPHEVLTQQLESNIKAIKKLICVAYYEGYVLPVNNKLTKANITDETIEKLSEKKVYFNDSVSGTATVIYHHGRRIAMLTCAHILDFPDTVISYAKSDKLSDEYMESIAFKIRQTNYAIDLPGRGNLEVLAMDKTMDIAVVATELPGISDKMIPVFSLPWGNSKNLKWGTAVYVISFPMGKKMITKGLVSIPDRNKRGAFLIDALFNEGASGGIILIINEKTPTFELVGLSKSVSADFDYYLTPSSEVERSDREPISPYEGDLIIKRKSDINYGITYTVSIEEIKKFFKDNHSNFLQKGYDFSDLF